MFMKTAAFALALSLAPSFALATQTRNFASCYGDHHGSYLNLWSVVGSASDDIAQVNIAVSNDSGDEPEIFHVTEVTKSGAVLAVKAYSWAIRQAIKAEAKDDFYGFVKVKAVNIVNGEVLYMNLNKFVGSDAMSIDGNMERLVCPADRVID
ncbi:MAG: hypothetical protein IOD12_07910 [Silvanigrellales bacterium]|jgi:hypothetical protein|nr:hypothetical protein [Silvanigrellales bacterium]